MLTRVIKGADSIFDTFKSQKPLEEGVFGIYKSVEVLIRVFKGADFIFDTLKSQQSVEGGVFSKNKPVGVLTKSVGVPVGVLLGKKSSQRLKKRQRRTGLYTSL